MAKSELINKLKKKFLEPQVSEELQKLRDNYRPKKPGRGRGDQIEKNPYVQGYLPTGAMGLINDFLPTEGLLGDFLGGFKKTLDDYSAYHTQDFFDSESNVFRYGLRDYDDDEFNYDYEDPTYPGFKIMLDLDSPLFKSAAEGTAQQFLISYGRLIPELEARLEIYDEFYKTLFKIFDTSDSSSSVSARKRKEYYIQTIDGLEKLNQKFIKYDGLKGDILTVTLTEDVTYIAAYLAELYNNLVYSYKYQRCLIPENCLRFDMYIRISDYRNFKIPNPAAEDTGIAFVTAAPSNMIYRLHDCTFSFVDSQTFTNSIQVGGFGAPSMAGTPATMQFKIYYKSVSKELNPNFIKGGIQMRNKMTDILNKKGVVNNDVLFDHNQDTYEQYTDDKEKGFKRLTSFLKDKAISAVEGVGDTLMQKLREKRGEMVNEMLSELRSNLKVPKIYPNNVYDDSFYKFNLQNVFGGAMASGYNSLETGIQSGLNF